MWKIRNPYGLCSLDWQKLLWVYESSSGILLFWIQSVALEDDDDVKLYDKHYRYSNRRLNHKHYLLLLWDVVYGHDYLCLRIPLLDTYSSMMFDNISAHVGQ